MADILDLDVQQEDMAIDEAGGEDEGGVETLKQRAPKKKGRGFAMENPRPEGVDEVYERIDFAGRAVDEYVDMSAQRSIEGWILMVTGIHEEAHEDDVHGRFAEYGEIKSLHLNLDRRSGFLKGYALIEFEHFKDASAAKNGLDGGDMLGNTIHVDWAFMKKPLNANRSRRRH
ncbi:RNA-binding protein 8A [Folsomia candida]|uniref:RNA-binding protein 8A n=1 Tax=Folsomia candida TaxID=158441 RepID=A0A226DK40_FOLCA|nr:RNA-binding protein 8A [Folsomia candida]OXA45559.1 RNA-binding protein 8A [Folsomia candida]